MNGIMYYNWLGIAFISDDLPPKIRRTVEKQMDKLEIQVNDEFDKWLEKSGLERVMGIIVKKGSIK